MHWKRAAIFLLALALGIIVLAMPVAANGDDWKKGWRGGKWDKDWDRGKWDRDWYPGGGGFYGGGWGGYPVITQSYAYPVAYPVYVPTNFGGDQGACYQACVNSGQYSPAQCGRMCYYA